MIRLGVFGLSRGMWFVKLAASVGAEIVAVCDKNQAALKAALSSGAVSPECAGYENFEDFISHDMDGVVLCNYFDRHAYYAIKCMERGIHVLCETTANATMAQGVALCRAKEKSDAIYMLAENYPFMRSNLELRRLYRSGSLGRILYAEGEYNHPASVHDLNMMTPSATHWRAYIPRTYYLTHSLAPIMYMTGGMPKKVNAQPIFAPEIGRGTARRHADAAAIMLCTMDDGSLTRITGCSAFGGHGLYYRLSCLKGTAETVRGNMDRVAVHYNAWEKPEGAEEYSDYESVWQTNGELAQKAGHGGGDFWVLHDFVRCIDNKEQPFFDVYRATAMASVGILAWRSVLNNGAAMEIPDFKKERDRALWENDDLSPFPDEDGNVTLPCSSEPHEPSVEDMEQAQKDWQGLTK